MQIMMNLGDYVSRDRKVNNFIKKLSEDEGNAIVMYIESEFVDGTIYPDELERACLDGEFMNVLIEAGLRLPNGRRKYGY